jgi:hypothetical protein
VAESWCFGVPVENISELKIVERVWVKTREDDRPQGLPNIGILGQRNQGSADGQFAAVALETAEELFEIAVTNLVRLLSQTLELARSLGSLTCVLRDLSADYPWIAANEANNAVVVDIFDRAEPRCAWKKATRCRLSVATARSISPSTWMRARSGNSRSSGSNLTFGTHV